MLRNARKTKCGGGLVSCAMKRRGIGKLRDVVIMIKESFRQNHQNTNNGKQTKKRPRKSGGGVDEMDVMSMKIGDW